MFEKILDFIYPRVCAICGKIMQSGEICENCFAKLPFINYNTCRYCGKRWEESEICLECRLKNFYYDQLMVVFEYDDKIRRKLIEFKFENQKYLAKFFAENMIRKLLHLQFKFDIIIPVPIHKKRYQKRGYNQSELLAKEIEKKLRIEQRSDILVKVKNTLPQSTLSKEARQKNIQNGYVLQKESVLKNKNILLLDDIYTTGATVNECSRILRKANAKSITVIVVAR